ncbi:MAG: beta-galactosidase trimerization domain-containing protein [Chloroflexi bacterium]|nr:beta-galactosidase trimerization domain-containing protein [Chloroflexota bacterium]
MAETRATEPWYVRPLRWMQLNTRANEVESFDVAWWGDYWARCRAEGVTVNAGGIVAFYPTDVPFHRRAPGVERRDLLGEIVAEARRRGLYVVGRLDPSQAHADAYQAHPEWFARRPGGAPYVNRPPNGPLLYQTCANSSYHSEQIPRILREILTRYQLDGFLANAWDSIPRRRNVCYCESCRRRFAADTGHELPEPLAAEWANPLWRRYVEWIYETKTALSRMIRDTIKSVRPAAIWLSLQQGDLISNAARGMDLIAVSEVAEVVQLEAQGRGRGQPLWWPGEAGRVFGAAADGKPCRVAINYRWGSWRRLSKPPAEQRLWLAELLAGGARPSIGVHGAVQDDRRGFAEIERLSQAYAAHEDAYRGLRSLASVALVYSLRTQDFYGRDQPEVRYLDHFRGAYFALLRARVPFDVLEARQLDESHLARYRAVVLPSAACLSETQAAALATFHRRGGGLVATFETSRHTLDGDPRPDFLLGDVLGLRWAGAAGSEAAGPHPNAYARLVDSHPVTAHVPRGTAGTDVLPCDGYLCPVEAVPGATVPLRFVPPTTIGPLEYAYLPVATPSDLPAGMQPSKAAAAEPFDPFVGGEPVSCELLDSPVLVCRAPQDGGGRTVYFAGDVDRRAWRDTLPDDLDLFAAAVRWTLGGEEASVAGRQSSVISGRVGLSVEVTGSGLIDIAVYEQPGRNRWVIHVVNLTHAGTWKGPMTELQPLVGQRLRLRLPDGSHAQAVRFLVSGDVAPLSATTGGERGVLECPMPEIVDREIACIDL